MSLRTVRSATCKLTFEALASRVEPLSSLSLEVRSPPAWSANRTHLGREVAPSSRGKRQKNVSVSRPVIPPTRSAPPLTAIRTLYPAPSNSPSARHRLSVYKSLAAGAQAPLPPHPTPPTHHPRRAKSHAPVRSTSTMTRASPRRSRTTRPRHPAPPPITGRSSTGRSASISSKKAGRLSSRPSKPTSPGPQGPHESHKELMVRRLYPSDSALRPSVVRCRCCCCCCSWSHRALGPTSWASLSSLFCPTAAYYLLELVVSSSDERFPVTALPDEASTGACPSDVGRRFCPDSL